MTVEHLQAILPVAARLCAMSRDWHDSASEGLGRVLHGTPTECRAAVDSLEAAQATHGAAMALLIGLELRLARCRDALAVTAHHDQAA